MIDQVIKNVILQTIPSGSIISIIPNCFFFTNVENTGGAWSILSEYTFVLTLINFICIIFLNQYLMKKDYVSQVETIYFGLIMGGMIGNFIDRVLYSGVIDFIGIKFGGYQFPIFNIADIAIVIGVGFVFLEMIRGEIDGHRGKKR